VPSTTAKASHSALVRTRFGGVDHEPHVVGCHEEHVAVEGDRSDVRVVDDLLLRLVEPGLATVTVSELDEPGTVCGQLPNQPPQPRSAG
jgi:hypothetical protein